jgi:adenosylcobinamide amidohydrolase
VKLSHRDEDGARLGSLLWEFGPGWRMISSAVLGGGIGPRSWVLNAQVVAGYARMDPAEHLAGLGPGGDGVGMMTAASVERYARAVDGGAEVVATVGLRVPTWAASPEGATDPELAPILLPAPGDPASARPVTGCPAPGDPAFAQPSGGPAPGDRASARPATGGPATVGTINIMAVLPVAMTDAALVNAVMTMTEAKTQALVEAGVAGTGTASDAVCLAVPAVGEAELFGGPRSLWGARLARAVHAAVLHGAEEWRPYDSGSSKVGK